MELKCFMAPQSDLKEVACRAPNSGQKIESKFQSEKFEDMANNSVPLNDRTAPEV